MSTGLKKLMSKAKSDRDFLFSLLDNPAEASAEFDLEESELSALTASSAGRLGSLVDAGVLAAGCGSSGTCTSTCTATCTVTFTSIAAGPGGLVQRS